MIEFEEVSFRYPGNRDHVLRDITFHVKKGEFLGISGPSGSGKSTLCLMMNGIIPKTIEGELSGEIYIDGENIKEKEVYEVSEKLGLILQNPESQLFSMTVEEELAFGPENLGIKREEIEERISWALELVGMEKFRDAFPHQLSGGEKQKIAIASLLTMKPEILVLDEPTSNLDPKSRIEIFKIVKKLNKKGMTVVVVEHETDFISSADKILILNDGKIVKYGTPREVFREADYLKHVGIRVPEIVEFSNYLLKGGYVDDIFLSVSEALEVLNVKDRESML
ncbi:MAG: ATP-binding cassette domain-containing protein [Methanomicrobia archaeon]|nr:ATP-binding cassette domain-containing protein [Methanomicrobia archaeon]HDM22226.1 ATP-binding cassette domain-containing protein [Methanomicrobia archaeon]